MVRLLDNRALHIAFIVLATGLCFWPGLGSLFLFDDGPNLDALVHIREASLSSPDFREFVLAGQAGPTGRPVSLFTFALQAAAWPGDPAAFKAINLLIHALSAVLVYLCSFRLAMHLRGERHLAAMVASTAALVWALQPVHTSTVLYTVQRMALLSNFFLLLGIYGHVALRLGAVKSDTQRSALLTLSLALTGLLALFSKENAPTLVFYLLVLEYTLLHDIPTGRTLRLWRAACLWLPAVILLLLPLAFLDRLQTDYADYTDFTMVERLLTQARVLWEYLAVLLLPTTGATGIFHDIPVSTSLFSPLATFIAIAAWIGLLALVLYRPGRHRIWLFAVLWFFSGHLVESSVLALELFFHHRNYLAFYGFVFALVYAYHAWLPATLLNPRLRVAIPVLYLLLLASNTARISQLWTQPLYLAERWYEAEPATSRNAEFYAMQLAQYGSEGEQLAAGVLEKTAASTSSFHLLLNLMTLACVNPAVNAPGEPELLAQADALSAENRNLVSPVQQIVRLQQEGNCPVYGEFFLENLIERLAAQSGDYDRGMFQFELARFRSGRGDSAGARALMEQAYANSGDPGVLFTLAVQLINAGDYNQALEYIDRAIADVTTSNNIRTGTRRSKLETLGSMREDVLGFMAGTR